VVTDEAMALPVAVPCRMHWCGLCVNALVLGLAFWLLALAPIAIRRLVRAKAGRCRYAPSTDRRRQPDRDSITHGGP
jgi:hypothetical protein